MQYTDVIATEPTGLFEVLQNALKYTGCGGSGMGCQPAPAARPSCQTQFVLERP